MSIQKRERAQKLFFIMHFWSTALASYRRHHIPHMSLTSLAENVIVCDLNKTSQPPTSYLLLFALYENVEIFSIRKAPEQQQQHETHTPPPDRIDFPPYSPF